MFKEEKGGQCYWSAESKSEHGQKGGRKQIIESSIPL